MALAQVAKINIIAHQKFQEKIIESLQDLGFIQIEDEEQKELAKRNINEEIANFDYKIAGVKFSLDFLASFNIEKKSLAEKLNPKIYLSLDQLQKIIQKFDYQRITKEVEELESKINQAKNQIEKSSLEITQIQPWQNLDFINNSQNLPKNYSFKLISVNDTIYSQLVNQLQKQLPLTEVQRVDQIKKEIRALIVFQIDQENKLSEILNNLNIKVLEIPELKVSIEQRLMDLNQIINQAYQDISKLEKKAQVLAKNIKDLKITSDYLSWQKEKLVSQQKIANSQQTFSLIGWISENEIKNLEKELNRITKDVLVEKLLVKKDEAPPVIFKNRVAKPFEMLTALYGAPKQGKPDPTPFLAPFFTLFFGMAMTDAGYGLIMAIGIWLAIKYLKIPKENQKLPRVLIWGGVATFILGALTGGWFSIDLGTLPAVISQPLIAIRLIDPMKDPIVIFYIALALGVTQVLTGLIIDAWWKIKHNEILNGLLGSGAWVFTLVFLLLFAFGSMGVLPATVGHISKWLTIIGAAIIVYNGTRGTKNIFLKPGIGILSLYGIVGYFSDVLSYSRLLALGLTTTIIGMVVNILAGLVFGIPFVGWFFALIILIGGHIFNLLVNALGAFIHSARLQFIEFFPKFFEAGGEIFTPFIKEEKYVKITK